MVKKIEAQVHQQLDFKGRMPQWVETLYRREKGPYALMHEQIEPLMKELKSL